MKGKLVFRDILSYILDFRRGGCKDVISEVDLRISCWVWGIFRD